MQKTTPQKIGKYDIVQEISSGAMGTIYKAYHTALQKDVAIKRLKITRNSTIQKRFALEAKILLEMNSPYIVHLHDYFIENGSHYIVEEFVEGLSLDKLIKKQEFLSPPIAALIFLDVCRALRYAHQKGIVHRDIKSANILVSKMAAVKLADFGIAASEKEESLIGDVSKSPSSTSTLSAALTQSGMILGTPAYMPPEQFVDSKNVTKKADIYALGVVFYEMLTGKKPYPGDFNQELINRIKKGKFKAPRKINKDVPPIINNLIKKMLKANEKKRLSDIQFAINKIKKYLFVFDTHALRVELAKIVLSKNHYTPQNLKPKKSLLKVILCASFSLLLLGSVAIFLGKRGFFYKTVLSFWYRPVAFVLDLPQNSNYSVDLSAKAFVFVDDSKDTPEIKRARRNFVLKKSHFAWLFSKIAKTKQKNKSGSKNSTSLKTAPLYLKNGYYRVKVVAGSVVWWQNFKIKDNDTLISFSLPKETPRLVALRVSCFDADTKKSINKKANVLVLYQGSWQNIKELPPEAIKAGTVLKLKVLVAGYKEDDFSFLIDWFQDELLLNCYLLKAQ